MSPGARRIIVETATTPTSPLSHSANKAKQPKKQQEQQRLRHGEVEAASAGSPTNLFGRKISEMLRNRLREKTFKVFCVKKKQQYDSDNCGIWVLLNVWDILKLLQEQRPENRMTAAVRAQNAETALARIAPKSTPLVKPKTALVATSNSCSGFGKDYKVSSNSFDKPKIYSTKMTDGAGAVIRTG
uniref:Ubiquitin-like protease family profile domain-containing protein n=1 Tax=Trichogramma kaykai TaxID=54128 RepID=A0ABD2XM80_9HYME